MMATMSSRAVNRAGISKVLLGLIMVTSWGIISPKKPPLAAPHRIVLIPHQKIISMKLGFLGFFFSRITADAATISSP